MSELKKQIRKNFKQICLVRDKFKCAVCGFKPSNLDKLDCHHIVNPKEMPNGGYVKENGIILCDDCHVKAEEFHSTGIPYPGYSVEDLFKIIKSSQQLAFIKSEQLIKQ